MKALQCIRTIYGLSVCLVCFASPSAIAQSLTTAKHILALITPANHVDPVAIVAVGSVPIFEADIFQTREPNRFKVAFSNPSRKQVVILIKDENQRTVYQKNVRKTELYHSDFNVSSLPEGNYTFTIVGKSGCYKKTFQVDPPLASLSQSTKHRE